MSGNHFAAAILLSLLPGCSCGGEQEPVTLLEAELVVTPTALLFDDTWVGLGSERELTVENLGSAPATMEVQSTGEGFRAEGSASLDPGERTVVGVRFAPQREGAHEGEVRLAGWLVPVAGNGVTLPDCDDGNECTDDRFDPVAGSCSNSFHGRACEADNVCLADAVCVEGECVGVVVNCATNSPCMVAFCDREVGCREEPIEGACADDNPMHGRPVHGRRVRKPAGG